MTEHTRICLVTRGDDLGAFQAANLAIQDAFRNGILRNTSIMVPAPHIEEAARLVKDERDVCLGLHVTITSEWDAPRWGPVSDPATVPSLLDHDGYFFRTPMEIYEHGVNIEEIMREVRAQLERARAMGLEIHYIDEHMGVGWLFHLSEERRLSHVLRELAHDEGLVWHKDAVTDYIPYTSLKEFQHTLQKLTPGIHLLITHPAFDGDEIRQVVGYGAPLAGQLAKIRAMDHQLLCDPEVKKIIQERNIQLLRYDECLEILS